MDRPVCLVYGVGTANADEKSEVRRMTDGDSHRFDGCGGILACAWETGRDMSSVIPAR